jgi:hypothetical protein
MYLKVYRNGFITLGSEGSSFSRLLPFVGLDSVKVPLIAPFWTDLYYDLLSVCRNNVSFFFKIPLLIIFKFKKDIQIGNYDKQMLSSETNLLNSLKTDLSFYLSASFTPDVAFLISWKNVKPNQASLEVSWVFLISFSNYSFEIIES